MKSDIDKEIKRLSNLKNYKDKSRAFIEKQAKINVKKRRIDIGSKFSNTEDKKIAKKLFDDYLDNYDIDDFSDLNVLADLIFEEVLKYNAEKQVDELRKNKHKLSDTAISNLHCIQDRILKLRNQLNLGKIDKEEDDLTALQSLKKRFEKYIPFNRNEFTSICSNCQTPLLFRRKVKDFENLKHPFFSGRFYYNPRGIALVKEGIWTKEQYAYVFYTSPDYVDWCIEHEGDIVKIDGINPDEIKDFIDKNPYLKKNSNSFRNFKEQKFEKR